MFRCTECRKLYASLKELKTHKCAPFVASDLDDEIAKSDFRRSGESAPKEDRYTHDISETFERRCPGCGTVLRNGQSVCPFCGPEDNDFRPVAAMRPKREWLRASGGLRVLQMTPDELVHYRATGELPAIPESR